MGERAWRWHRKKRTMTTRYYADVTIERHCQKHQGLSTEDKIYQQSFIDEILINKFLSCKCIL